MDGRFLLIIKENIWNLVFFFKYFLHLRPLLFSVAGLIYSFSNISEIPLVKQVREFVFSPRETDGFYIATGKWS